MKHEVDSNDNSNSKKPLELVFVGRAEKELKQILQDLPKHRAKQVINCIEYLLARQPPNLEIGHLHVSKNQTAMAMKLQGSPAVRVVFTTKENGKLHILHVCKKTAEGTDQALIRTVELRLKAL